MMIRPAQTLLPAAAVDRPPVLILGGEANALSIARRLHRRGVRVFALAEPGSCVRHSRCSEWVHVDAGADLEKAWARFLLGPKAARLRGCVLLAASDAAIRVIASNRPALALRYRLDASNPAAQLAMLDKQTTYQHAAAAGVPTPRFWIADSRDHVLKIEKDLVYPLLVKPRHSHLFEKHFGKKHVTVGDFSSLLTAYDVACGAGMQIMLVELIPGPDTQLCSYYTYMNEGGDALFDFTKRIIRRYPAGMGGACYHITDWAPQIIEHSKTLLRQAGLVGLANIEFKLDPRDGVYKLIECNARFTAANCLVASSGIDLANLVYDRIIGRPTPEGLAFKRGVRLWDPARDFLAFRELRRLKQISFARWIASICHPQTMQFFAWTDPMPALVKALRPLTLRFAKAGKASREVPGDSAGLDAARQAV